MASKTMHYVEAHKNHTDISLPIFGTSNSVEEEAKIVINNLAGHGWLGPFKSNNKETNEPIYHKKPILTSATVDSRHPHWRPFLADA